MRDGKPVHIDHCLNCIQDPGRQAKLRGEIILNGQVYEKVGLPIRTKKFRE